MKFHPTTPVKEFDPPRYRQRQLRILRCLSTKSAPYFKRTSYPKAIFQMLITTYQTFVRKLLIILKQCDRVSKSTVFIVRRTRGNVVQSIPFVDANRDDDVLLSWNSSSRLWFAHPQSLPSLIGNSPHLSYLLGKIAEKKKRLESTRHTCKK